MNSRSPVSPSKSAVARTATETCILVSFYSTSFCSAREHEDENGVDKLVAPGDALA